MNDFRIAKNALARILANVDLEDFGKKVIRFTTDFDPESYTVRDLKVIATQEACRCLHRAIYDKDAGGMSGVPNVFDVSVDIEGGVISNVCLIFKQEFGAICTITAGMTRKENYTEEVLNVLKRM